MLYKKHNKIRNFGIFVSEIARYFQPITERKKNRIDLVDPAIPKSKINLENPRNFQKCWFVLGKLEILKKLIDEPNLMSQFTAEKLSRFSLRLKASNSSTNCSSLISLMLFKLSSLRHNIYIRRVSSQWLLSALPNWLRLEWAEQHAPYTRILISAQTSQERTKRTKAKDTGLFHLHSRQFKLQFNHILTQSVRFQKHKLVSEPLTQMAVELINNHLISVQQKR